MATKKKTGRKKMGTQTTGLQPGSARLDSADNYIRKTSNFVYGEGYLVSTETSYNLIYGQREKMSKALLDSVKMEIKGLADNLAKELKPEEDKVISNQIKALGLKMGADEFVTYLNEHARGLEIKTDYDSNKEFTNVWKRFRDEDFDEKYMEYLVTGKKIPVDTSQDFAATRTRWQTKTRDMVKRQVENVIAVANMLQDEGQRTKIFGGVNETEDYIVEQMTMAAEMMRKKASDLGFVNLPPLNIKTRPTGNTKPMYHIIGNLYELNEMTHLASAGHALMAEAQDEKNREKVLLDLEEHVADVAVTSFGKLGSSSSKGGGKVKAYGTVDASLSFTDKFQPILIDMKSASSSSAVKDKYIFNIHKFDLTKGLRDAVEKNDQVRAYYRTLLVNIYNYSRLHLNENEQKAVIHTAMSAADATDLLSHFESSKWGEGVFPTVLSVSTEFYRFSDLIEKMAEITVAGFGQTRFTYKETDNPAGMGVSEYTRKIEVWRGGKNSKASDLRNQLRAKSHTLLEEIYNQKQSGKIALQVRLK